MNMTRAIRHGGPVRINTHIEEAHKALDGYEKTAHFALLAEARARLDFLSERLQVEALKNIVIGEVLRMAPECLDKFLEALDEDDRWWTAKQSFTLGQWRDFLTTVYKEDGNG